MKRWLLLLAAFMLAGATMLGCGGENGSTEQDQPPQTQPEGEEAPAPPAPPP